MIRKIHILKISIEAKGVAQVVKGLPSKLKTWSSNPNTGKKKSLPSMVAHTCNPVWEVEI
jgi:hypothetical protein